MPHAALHQHVGTRAAALLAIEWVFHGGAILAIGALLYAMSGPASRAAPGDNATADKSSVDFTPSPVTGQQLPSSKNSP
jgi:predicted membrane channel-forming protein YqfA (hemolysin III family)